MRVYAGDIGFHMILPVLVLTLINFAGVMLLTRSSMLETLREDYILTARARPAGGSDPGSPRGRAPPSFR